MTVYLGDAGIIELARSNGGRSIVAEIDPADVNATVNRFSFKFQQHEFNTGDLLEFTVIDANGQPSSTDIDFVEPSDFPDGKASFQSEWYAHVDYQRGIRLYHTQAAAIDGEESNAVQLKQPALTQKVRVRLMNNDYKCFGQLQSFELNTDREVVDTTALGEGFRKRLATIISGSGIITAFWDYKLFTDCCQVDYDVEVSNYMHQLVLRQDQGSNFRARFYLKRPEIGCEETAVYYQAEAVISQVAITFNTDDTVTSRISFVTTGEVKLLVRPVPDTDNLVNQTGGAYLLQNGTGKLKTQTP